MPEVTGDNHVQNTVLEDLSSARHYRRWLASLAAPHLGQTPIEIGSGLGDYAVEWTPACAHFTCSEADQERLAMLQQRFRTHPRIDVLELSVPISRVASHSAVVAYNVLEHIPDDHDALAAMASLVEPGGRVIILVPAFNFAFSRFDREIGHQRRYTIESLTRTAEAAGLAVERAHYVNALGLLAWVVMMRLLRRRPQAGLALDIYDRSLVPILSRLETLHRPPFGQSVFLVARTRPT